MGTFSQRWHRGASLGKAERDILKQTSVLRIMLKLVRATGAHFTTDDRYHPY